MNRKTNINLAVLVVEDVAETRDGIEALLRSDGYRVTVARDECDAIESAQLKHPDLILVSLAGPPQDVTLSARRIRDHAGLGESVPVVIFCNEEIAAGEEVAIGQNVHVARPDNFNQLRSLITRLLNPLPPPVSVQIKVIVTGEKFMSSNSTMAKPLSSSSWMANRRSYWN